MDWYDELDGAMARHDDCTVQELLLRPPEHALLVVASQLSRCLHSGGTDEDIDGLTRAVACLLLNEGDAEAACVLSGERSPWFAMAELALKYPARWSELVEHTPGVDRVDRTERAMRRLLLHGVSYRAVLARLSRRGPIPALEAVARTGTLSQFDFGDRAKRARTPDRKITWTKLAILAADAIGHYCCVGMFTLELEELTGENLEAVDFEGVSVLYPIMAEA